jgi:uncharacterized protein (DUF433 family)
VTLQTDHPYIIRDDQILGGEPIVRGSRTPVRAIVEMRRLGILPEDVPRHLPHLTLAQVYDALGYAADHAPEIERFIEANRVPDQKIHPLVQGN